MAVLVCGWSCCCRECGGGGGRRRRGGARLERLVPVSEGRSRLEGGTGVATSLSRPGAGGSCRRWRRALPRLWEVRVWRTHSAGKTRSIAVVREPLVSSVEPGPCLTPRQGTVVMTVRVAAALGTKNAGIDGIVIVIVIVSATLGAVSPRYTLRRRRPSWSQRLPVTASRRSTSLLRLLVPQHAGKSPVLHGALGYSNHGRRLHGPVAPLVPLDPVV